MVNRSSGKNMELKKINLNNKKGIFFMLLVIVIITLFLASYTLYLGIESRKSIQQRVETMSNFLNSIEEDLDRQLFISSFRIFFLLNKYTIENQEYVDNVTFRFHEGFFNGTIYNQTNENITIIMKGATFSNFTYKINQNAAKINVDVNFSTPIIKVEQLNPWTITVSMDMNMTMKDKGDLASWERVEHIVIAIPVEGFEDPTYPLGSGNPGIVNVINRTNYTTFPTDLTPHTTGSFYINSTYAPSFIDRLEGKLHTTGNSACCGIESLVNVPELQSAHGHTPRDRSIVDYHYWNASYNLNDCQLAGYGSWVILDDESSHNHREFYGDESCV